MRQAPGNVRIDAMALGACAGLTALVYLAAIRPTLGSQARASEDYQQYQTRSQQADDLARRASELEKASLALRKSLDASRVKLRKITEVNATLDELANLARSHQVEIEAVSSGEAQQGTMLAMAPVKLAATGTFADVVAFLCDLEASHPEISATKFAIEAMRDSDKPPATQDRPGSRTRLTMSLEWYAEPAGPAGKAPGKIAGTTAP